ncbi:MAG: YIEGIA family protein [Desulfurispora sp.]|uniref:YIEGIA family protein n=1 Tax=Desulfurispora sp. TaxID=3014275 RepID=UPI004049F4F0
MPEFLKIILVGTLAGTVSRLLLLRLDYRQYPGYPHGVVAHVSLGVIASALGAVLIPALLKQDYTAVTFLALAAQQFREIRQMERTTLENLEINEMVKRGNDYIEGIARTFEARNYLVMATAVVVSACTYWGDLPGGLLAAAGCIVVSRIYMTGKSIGQICHVIPATVHFNGALLKVDQIDIMNVGLPEMREKILKEALAVRIVPRSATAAAIINDLGQRMAIAHTAAVILGTKKEIDMPELTPLARKDIDSGEVGLFILPVHKDMDALLLAVRRTPVLESSRSKPLATQAGRMARR